MKKYFALLLTFTLTACGQIPISEYADNNIQFDPNTFFNSTIVAKGFIKNRSGKMTRSFTADIIARWDENGGVLDEVFQWSDGEVQTRVWQFERTGDKTYIGTAGDVIGEAAMEYAGNAIHMNYLLDVPLESGKTIAIRMDDWLYQVSEETIVNVTSMSKWGFDVGEVVLTMRVVE